MINTLLPKKRHCKIDKTFLSVIITLVALFCFSSPVFAAATKAKPTQPAGKLTISKAELHLVSSQYYQLYATYGNATSAVNMHIEATQYQDKTKWTSSNENIATVSEIGRVSMRSSLNPGDTVTITATRGDQTTTCKITVVETKGTWWIGDNGIQSPEKVTSITIPEGYTSIGSETCMGATALKNVTIPDSMQKIGDSAFKNCSKLASINLPDGITEIGNYAFEGCSSLKTVMIPQSLKSGINANTPYGVFKDCTGLTEAVIGGGNIWQGLFVNCPALKKLHITGGQISGKVYPGFVSKIVELTLINAEYSEDTIAWLPDVEKITVGGNKMWGKVSAGVGKSLPNLKEMYAVSGDVGNFSNHKNLVSVNIGEYVNRVYSYIFENCTALKNVTINASITELSGTFRGCTSLAEITIPETVTRLDRTFEGCTSLKKITIPKNVTNIVGNAFSGSGIKEIIIPETVTNVYRPFDSCPNLEKVTFLANSPLPDYTFSNLPALKTVILGDGVTKIGRNAFSRCTSLQNIIIGKNVKSIGETAFEYCSSLTSIVIPDNVTDFSTGIFKRCTSLVSVTLPSSLTVLPKETFAYCESLKSVKFPSALTTIQEYAFDRCLALEELKIPEGVTTIENSALGAALKKLEIPTTVTSPSSNYVARSLEELIIRGGTVNELYYMYNLKTLVITDNASLDSEAFMRGDLPALENLTITGKTKTFKREAFYSCEKLKNVTLQVENIPEYALSNSVENITLLEGVKTIGECAFYGTHIKSIVIPDSVERIENVAIMSCPNLEKIYIGKGVNYISLLSQTGGPIAFAMNCPKLVSIEVSPENKNYASEDGVLFNKDKTRLLRYPQTRLTDFYRMPDTVKSIEYEAFDFTDYTIYDQQLTSEEQDKLWEENRNIHTFGLYIPDSLDYSEINGNINWKITKIKVNDNSKRYCIIDNILYSKDKTILYGVPRYREGILEIPEGVTTIKYDSLWLNVLPEIHIPKTLTTIETNGYDNICFGNASGIKNIVVNPENPAFASEDGVLFSKDKTVLYFYPHANERTSYTVPSTVKVIKRMAFQNSENLIEVYISEGCQTIGGEAFWSCGGLKTIHIPKTCRTIERDAFSGCNNLETVTGAYTLKDLYNY